MKKLKMKSMKGVKSKAPQDNGKTIDFRISSATPRSRTKSDGKMGSTFNFK